MVAAFHNREIKLRPSLLAAVMIAFSAGCAKSRPADTDPVLSNLRSASHLLLAEQTDTFRPGRSIDDVLQTIRWRGNLEEAISHEGKSVCSIGYMLLPEGATSGVKGEWLLAIFIDDRFVKFV